MSILGNPVMISGGGGGGGGGTQAIGIYVTADTGATVTASGYGGTYTGTETGSGAFLVLVPDYGTYTVTATAGGDSESKSITIPRPTLSLTDHGVVTSGILMQLDCFDGAKNGSTALWKSSGGAEYDAAMNGTWAWNANGSLHGTGTLGVTLPQEPCDNYTIEVFMVPAYFTNTVNIYSKTNGDAHFNIVGQIGVYDTNRSFDSSTYSRSVNTPVSLAVTKEWSSGGGRYLRLYENGVLTGSSSDAQQGTDAAGTVTFGGYYDHTWYFVRIYNRALTAAEVAANYANDVRRLGDHGIVIS